VSASDLAASGAAAVVLGLVPNASARAGGSPVHVRLHRLTALGSVGELAAADPVHWPYQRLTTNTMITVDDDGYGDPCHHPLLLTER
jgi:hypothetical protein